MDNKGGNGAQRGRIILLGDGTEVLTDSDNTEMFDDQGEEDKDLASQAPKVKPESKEEKVLSSDALPEKLDTSDPKYKAVVDEVATSHSTDSKDTTSKDT